MKTKKYVRMAEHRDTDKKLKHSAKEVTEALEKAFNCKWEEGDWNKEEKAALWNFVGSVLPLVSSNWDPTSSTSELGRDATAEEFALGVYLTEKNSQARVKRKARDGPRDKEKEPKRAKKNDRGDLKENWYNGPIKKFKAAMKKHPGAKDEFSKKAREHFGKVHGYESKEKEKTSEIESAGEEKAGTVVDSKSEAFGKFMEIEKEFFEQFFNDDVTAQAPV